MLSGIVLFGAVIAFLRSEGYDSGSAMDGETSPLALAAAGLVVTALGTVFVLRRLVQQSDDPARRFQLGLVAFALCEAAALLGGVLWLLTGTWTVYVTGVLVYLVAFAWIPVSHE